MTRHCLELPAQLRAQNVYLVLICPDQLVLKRAGAIDGCIREKQVSVSKIHCYVFRSHIGTAEREPSAVVVRQTRGARFRIRNRNLVVGDARAPSPTVVIVMGHADRVAPSVLPN